MKKETAEKITVAAGVALLAFSFLLLKIGGEPHGMMRPVPYIGIGLGCGLFGHGMGLVINRRTLIKSPEIAKRIAIEARDERNMAIASQAKAKAFDLMTYIFGALMVSFALMEVDLPAVLLLVATYLFVEGYGIYCRFQLEKKI